MAKKSWDNEKMKTFISGSGVCWCWKNKVWQ